MMNKYYFTFGTNPQFPFGEHEFVMIEAESIREAAEIFRKLWPDRPGHEGVLNCADCYTESQFTPIRKKHYDGKEPSAVFLQPGRRNE